MLDPVVDLFSQLLHIARLIAVLLRQGIGGGGGQRAVRDQRHGALGEGLHAAHALDLHIGAVHIQIGTADFLQQFLLRVKPHDRRVGQGLPERPVLILQRAPPGQDQLDVGGMAASTNCLHQRHLVFFIGIPTHADDGEAVISCGTGMVRDHFRRNTVGYHPEL